MTPSQPTGDAPCPHCGTLLWYVQTEKGLLLTRKLRSSLNPETPADAGPKFQVGETVRIKEGGFKSFEGEVTTVDDSTGRVIVSIEIFGRSTPVELMNWEIERI
jgi:transcription antitermination factor NusG